MDPITISLIGVVSFIVLLSQGMPIAFAFTLVGTLGIILLRGLVPGLSMLDTAPFTWGSAVSLLPLPLFILMGQFAVHSGISQDLYDTAHKWIGRFRGGLALATVAASTGFAACSGSSVASAATMATIAYPAMSRPQIQPSAVNRQYRRRRNHCHLDPAEQHLHHLWISHRDIDQQAFRCRHFPRLGAGGIVYAGYIGLVQTGPHLGPRRP